MKERKITKIVPIPETDSLRVEFEDKRFNTTFHEIKTVHNHINIDLDSYLLNILGYVEDQDKNFKIIKDYFSIELFLNNVSFYIHDIKSLNIRRYKEDCVFFIKNRYLLSLTEDNYDNFIINNSEKFGTEKERLLDEYTRTMKNIKKQIKINNAKKEKHYKEIKDKKVMGIIIRDSRYISYLLETGDELLIDELNHINKGNTIDMKKFNLIGYSSIDKSILLNDSIFEDNSVSLERDKENTNILIVIFKNYRFCINIKENWKTLNERLYLKKINFYCS